MHFADEQPQVPSGGPLAQASLLTTLGLISGVVVLAVGIVAVVRSGQEPNRKKSR